MLSLLQHPRLQRHAQRLMKFFVAGGLGAIVDFSVLNGLSWGFNFDPRVANVFSTLISSLLVFAINKFFAFRDRKGHAGTQAFKFFLTYALAYVLNVVFTALFITAGIYLLPELHLAVISNVSKALAIGTVMFWNYFLLHKFVFREKVATV